jgi:predicted HicB family RNase H-like nuclease
MKFLEHAGYTGTFEIEDDVLVGKVLGIRDLVTFEAASPKELVEAFKDAVEDYLADCAEEGLEPDKPFKGRYSVRVSKALHKRAALLAEKRGTHLNAITVEALDAYLAKHVD